MNRGEFEIVVRKDSTFPVERARALKRLGVMLARFPNGISDRVNCFLQGLTKGWVLSQTIGLADAEEVDQLLPPRPGGSVIEAIPYGPKDISHPEFDALTDDDIPEGIWFDFWMGIKNCLYFFNQQGATMPERFVFAWLGFLRGELEGGAISISDYDKLRALLPQVHDDLTPLAVATQ